jgi:hypothetical protein
VAVDKVFIEDNGHAVAAQAADGRDFVYWHVAPVVRQRSGMTPEGP